MKKLLILVAFIGLLLFGCSDGEMPDAQKNADFLSTEEGRYGIYIVADTEDQLSHELLESEDIRNVKSWRQYHSLEEADLDNRLEEVTEVPTYLVFDTEKKVFEANSKEELFEFLREN